MKRLILFPLALLVGMAACKREDKTAAGKGSEAQSFEKQLTEHNKKVFDQAMKHKDPYTAMYAANSLLLTDSAGSRKMLDTLAGIYAALQMNGSANMIADQILKTEPENRKMLEIKVGDAMARGNTEEALNLNRKLYGISKDGRHLFQIAYIQIESQKVQDADATLKELESHPGFMKDSVDFQSEAQGIMQKVPMQAADLYLRGFMEIRRNNYGAAAQKMQQALKIYPNFYKAKENMQLLAQAMQQQQGQMPRR
jgi:tetratricopeptide (TPR) repeat protein